MTRTILAISAVVFGVMSVPVLADDHGKRHGSGKGGGTEAMLDRLEMWDGDGDGAVTQAEVDAFRAARLAAFDADGNGVLDLAEYQALWLDAMRDRMVDRFQAHDDDGDGVVTVDEFGADFSRLVRRMDRDGDGSLSPADFERRGKGTRRGKGRDKGNTGKRGTGKGGDNSE